jgi:hypothetical protein
LCSEAIYNTGICPSNAFLETKLFLILKVIIHRIFSFFMQRWNILSRPEDKEAY